ncbi:MAG: zinc ribbon domain-containing protein [Candidatus Krumholzibacteriota bacterium]|nr:zinc ribbon domain-containing protein [Candidatus Krumholzibacteriota bacterium]
MYCRYCGKEMEEGSTFCVYCGKGRDKETTGKSMYMHEWTKLRTPDESKNPGVAASIGFFLGWILLGPIGYVYLGQWNWFWLTFVIQIFAVPLTAGVAYILLPVVFAIHQYQMAKELNEMVVAARADLQVSGRREDEVGSQD